MLGLHLLVAELLGGVMGSLDRFLGFYGKFIKLHIFLLSCLESLKNKDIILFFCSREKVRMIQTVSSVCRLNRRVFSGKADLGGGRR
jgi:hypothetical protein